MLRECPYGVEWCDPDDHLCPECSADEVDRVYDEERDRKMEEGKFSWE